MGETVTICECFARDGLQHEAKPLPTVTKIALLEGFARAGFRRIEATSYSHPDRVPGFADATKVLAAVPRGPGLSYKATCPNPRAVERALADLEAGHGPEEISILVSATEGHTRRNLHTSRADQWQRVAQMFRLANGRFRTVGVVSVAFGCPFDGVVQPDRVVEDVGRFVDLGVTMVSLGDTIGTADPKSVRSMIARLDREYPGLPVVFHFHNTRGTGIANAVAALEAGCRNFDTAMGGIGGHPSKITYGSGLTGNVCTEDFVSLLESMGIETGIDIGLLEEVSRACEAALERPLNSLVARAGFEASVAALPSQTEEN